MLRSAKITYSDGTEITTSLAGHLTDKEIHDYFKVGSLVNIGDGPRDNMQKIISCEIAPLQGLIVEVYKPADGHDCTNNGKSSTINRVLLAGDGIPELFEASADCPAFRLVKRQLFGAEYLHIEPWERPTGSGWMYGGNIADTSDSRKPWKYPVHIHDRQEF
jgi:hypothetical protein